MAYTSRTTFKGKLAYELSELIDLPLDRHQAPFKAHKLINTVLDVIKNALIRGEAVSIPGFGTFKVIEQKARRTGNNIISQDGTRSQSPICRKARKSASFIPSEQLLALVDGPTTWHTRRAIRKWNQ